MARFERDGRFVELWLERPGERIDSASSGTATGTVVHQWPELRTRTSEQPDPVVLARRYEWSASGDLDRAISEHLRAGWRRVRDPARDADVDGEPRDAALDAAVLADPDTALVYADWLQQRAHPRGALIAVQHARRAKPDDDALGAEEQRLFDDHIEELYGPLWSYCAPDGEACLELRWHQGFIRGARLGRCERGDDVLWELLRHPSARFLRELEIGCHRAGDQNNELIADILLRAGPHPPLRSLVLADFDHSNIDNIDISRAPLGDLSTLGACYPLLEHVTLKGNGDVVLGDLQLPRARQFALRTSTLTLDALRSIVCAPWPVLEELELWFGDPGRGYGAQCELADALPLFACELPRVRVLALRNAMFTDELVPEILAWRGASQLEELDVSLGTLTDDGAAALAAGRSVLPRLRRLGVFECSLTSRGFEALRSAGYVVDDAPIAPAFAWREPQQKSGRYTSVNE